MSKITLRLWCALGATSFIPLLNGCSGGTSDLFRPLLPPATFTERIVFVRPLSSGVDGPIYISETDGKNPVLLTNQRDSQPVISGKIVAFVRNNQLWTINVDGSNLKQITTGALSFVAVADPAWNPSGTQIAFAGRKTFTEPYNIYVLRFSDNKLFQLTGTSPNPNTSINPPPNPNTVSDREQTAASSDEFDPAWSPNADQIVFATNRHTIVNAGTGLFKSTSELYKINVSNGVASGLTRLTRHDFGGGTAPNTLTGNPVFSSDGTRILFESLPDKGIARRLYSIPANAIALTVDKWTAYTSDATSNTAPAISTDGKTVVWSRDGNIVAAPYTNGSTVRVLTKGIQPSWGRFVNQPTPTPTVAPTVRPTATSTSSPFSRSLMPLGAITLKREANGSVSRFTNIYVTGDHEADGGGAIQAFVKYSLASVPSGAKINSAILDLAQTPRDGNPFGNLGPSYVELATGEALNEGALLSGARQISTTRVEAASVDITPLLQQAVNARQSEIMLRLRFRDVKNNNGQNDNMNNVFGLIRYTSTP